MAKSKINLHVLPTWLKYLISLTVIALVVGAAMIFGGNKPAPDWIPHRLIPVLGWIYLALVAYLIIHYIVRRFKK
jgi:hypothetical protein